MDLGVSQVLHDAASTAWAVRPAAVLHRKSDVDAAELDDRDLQERAEPRKDVDVLVGVTADQGSTCVAQGEANVADVENLQDALVLQQAFWIG